MAITCRKINFAVFSFASEDSIGEIVTSWETGYIALSIVPYWTSLPPDEYRSWFQGNAHFIGDIMIPLGASAIGLSLAGLITSFRTDLRRDFAAHFICLLFAGLLYPLFFAPTGRGNLGRYRG